MYSRGGKGGGGGASSAAGPSSGRSGASSSSNGSANGAGVQSSSTSSTSTSSRGRMAARRIQRQEKAERRRRPDVATRPRDVAAEVEAVTQAVNVPVFLEEDCCGYPRSAYVHVQFIKDWLRRLEMSLEDGGNEDLMEDKMNYLLFTLDSFTANLKGHIDKQETSLSVPLELFIQLLGFLKPLLATGDARLSSKSHFVKHTICMAEVAKVEGIRYWELNPEEYVLPLEKPAAQQMTLDTISVVRLTIEIFQLLISPSQNGKYDDELTRFEIFCWVVNSQGDDDFSLSDLFNLEGWNKKTHRSHPFAVASILGFLKAGVELFAHRLADPVNNVGNIMEGLRLLPVDTAAIVNLCVNVASMMMDRYFAVEFMSFYAINEAPKPISAAATELYATCINLKAWTWSSETAKMVEFGLVLDALIEADFMHGNLPTASLAPFIAYFRNGFATKQTLPYAFREVPLEELNAYAGILCAGLLLKLKRPLKHYLKDYKLQPHFAMLYAFVTILERNAAEGAPPGFYAAYSGSTFLTRGFEALEYIYGNHPTVFLNTVEPVVDMIGSMMSRLIGSRIKSYVVELHYKKVNGKEHPVCVTGFYKCISGIQYGLKAIERVLAGGGTVSIDVEGIIKKVLDIGNQMDRIAQSEMICSYLDGLGEIAPGIATMIPESTLKEVVNRVLHYRYDAGNPKSFTAEVGAKAGRAIGKLVLIPQFVMNEKLIGVTFTDGFSNLMLGEFGGGQPPHIRSNWAWAIAELSQSVQNCVKNHGFCPPNSLLKHIIICLDHVIRGIPKSRYNGYRACGNVFTFLHPMQRGKSGATQSEKEGMFKGCEVLIKGLIQQLGAGQEYKNRWNAAFGLGCVFENEELIKHMSNANATDSKGGGSLLTEIVTTLAKWARKSQNYKERTQCLIALQKMESRYVLNVNLETVLSQLVQSLAGPSEENEQKNKFEMEVVLTICSIVALVEPSDAVSIETVMSPAIDSLRALFTDVATKVVGDKADVVVKARDRLASIRHEMSTSGDMIEVVISLLNILIGEEETELFDIAEEEDESVNRFSVDRFSLLAVE